MEKNFVTELNPKVQPSLKNKIVTHFIRHTFFRVELVILKVNIGDYRLYGLPSAVNYAIGLNEVSHGRKICEP